MAANDPPNYGQLIGKRFTGKYVGKDQSATWAMFEVNAQGNDGIKSIFEQIRQSVGNQVRLLFNSIKFVDY